MISLYLHYMLSYKIHLILDVFVGAGREKTTKFDNIYWLLLNMLVFII